MLVVTAIIQHYDTIDAIRATNRFADAAEAQASAANKSADLSESAARAWVAPIRFEFAHPTDAADPLKVRVAIQNVGREPARALTHYLGTGVINSPSLPVAQWSELPDWAGSTFLEPHEICKALKESANYAAIYPSTSSSFLFDIPIVSQLPVDEIEHKRTVYFVGGCFSYESLHRRRYTTFCAFPNPEGHGDNFAEWPFSACPKGNDDYTEDR
jgi:hypothetical protein